MAREDQSALRIRRFDGGVTVESVDGFLADVHLFVDGLDFFEIGIRRRIFARCRELRIPAITAGADRAWGGLSDIHQQGMSFEQYYRFEGRSEPEQFLRFLIGMVPKGLHRRYLVDPDPDQSCGAQRPVDGRGRATLRGCDRRRRGEAAAGPGWSEAGAWHVISMPYLDRYAVTRLAFGLGGPVQRVKLAVAWRAISRRLKARPAGARPAADPPDHGRTPVEEILNLARWTPSGDNTQPWRFQVIGRGQRRDTGPEGSVQRI